MKKVLLISCVMLTLAATAAVAASGLNLTWGPSCAPAGLIINRTFACNTNAAPAANTQSMVLSFKTTADHDFIIAVDAYMDGQTSHTSWPAWWQFKNSGTCRATALSFAITPLPGCDDPWASQASGAVTFYGNPDATFPVSGIRARMKATASLPLGSASPVTAASEYYAFQLNISNAKTIGSAPCADCDKPVAWVLNSLVLSYVDGAGDPPTVPPGILTSEKVETPLLNQCISWQNGQSLCGATPTQNKTWGQVKSLYR
jgi:hypothetical protein